MKKKEDNKEKSISPYIFLLVMLFLLRIIGPVQTFFEWSQVFNFIINSCIIIFFALILKKLIERVVTENVARRFSGYVLFIGAGITIFFIIQNKIIAASISLGIIVAVLAFVFQTPLLNLIGWVYLTAGHSYRVGDRVRIKNIKGDVIDINPIRTKVQEVGGEYVQADVYSGRLYTFPNALVLSEPISNYTKFFPFIWVDASFHLTYETDFAFVMKKINDIIAQHYKNEKEEMEGMYNRFTRIFDLKKEKFSLAKFYLVTFQSWMELRVTFPVDTKLQSVVITEITQKILKMFNQYPEKVRFPEGRTR
jgi:small-conductance mechanosensitive channel